jgi:hypothetical protein
VSLCIHTISLADHDSYEGNKSSEYMFGLTLHASRCLLLLRLAPPAGMRSVGERVRWGLNTLWDARAGLKPARTDAPGTTKAQFLLRRAGVAVLRSVAWYFLRQNILLPSDIGPPDFGPGKESLFQQIWHRTLTPRDLRLRAGLAVYIHLPGIVILSTAHGLAACIAVGVFNAPHSSWPPLYGNPLEAYSLRRWYSHFWHLVTPASTHLIRFPLSGLHPRSRRELPSQASRDRCPLLRGLRRDAHGY